MDPTSKPQQGGVRVAPSENQQSQQPCDQRAEEPGGKDWGQERGWPQ